MRHFFIINPEAGRRDQSSHLKTEIEKACSKHGIEPLIFISEYAGYEREMAEKICSLFPGDKLRIYSVGGSGTLANIVSGISDFENTEVACYPSGLTNDILKSYGNSAEYFRSFDALIDGRVDLLDMIEINGYRPMIFSSFGLGNNYFNDQLIFKLLSMIHPTFSYSLSVFFDILGNKGKKYNIEIDGKNYDGMYVFVVALNGMCMGGAKIPLHDPRPNDGLLDFLMIYDMPRFKQLQVMSAFGKSDLSKYGDVIRIVRGKRMKVSCADRKTVVFNVDGECVRSVETVISVPQQKLRFIVPHQSHILEPTYDDIRVE